MTRLACLAVVLLVLASAGARADGHGLANLAWLGEPVPAPDTAFRTGTGEQVTLADFKGRAVVLNFWATWCAPCREEMPSLDRLAEMHGGDDLIVLPISVDRGEIDRIQAFYAETGVRHLGVFHDPDMRLARKMRVFGLPTTMLIDHDGRIVAQLVGPAEWDSDEALEAVLPLGEAAGQARAAAPDQARLGD
jgi:thiol-disulfide isomerase/thioredoxin